MFSEWRKELSIPTKYTKKYPQVSTTKNQTPILIASDLSFPYMRRQLKDLGLTNVYDCDFIFSRLEVDLKESNVIWSETKLKQKIDL